jgi:hypothetical protein
MSDVAVTFTLFHTLAAVAVFAFMVVSVIQHVQDRRQSKR